MGSYLTLCKTSDGITWSSRMHLQKCVPLPPRKPTFNSQTPHPGGTRTVSNTSYISEISPCCYLTCINHPIL